MDVKAGRYTANYPEGFVVVLIGLRINQLWRVNEWLPVFRQAFTMTKQAMKLPGQPLLNSFPVLSGQDPRTLFFIQHWRSFDALTEWSNDARLQHKPAMKGFFKRTAYNGHVGVWHEVYQVQPGEFEAIYANMPRMSMAAAGTHRELRKTSKARDRMGDGSAH